jgi:Family of unknown function (DUF6092)
MDGISDDERLFELAAFLVSSAGLTLVEAPRSGAVRLLMAASRLVDSFEPDDRFLRELKASIDENVVKVMWDYEGLVTWLNDLTARVGAEALARQGKIGQSRADREEEE